MVVGQKKAQEDALNSTRCYFPGYSRACSLQKMRHVSKDLIEVVYLIEMMYKSLAFTSYENQNWGQLVYSVVHCYK
jgi:hypothetical protein